MINKDEFRQSPKFTALTAKVKATLDADPDYIQAASELEFARNMYREMEQQAMDADDAMSRAEDAEEDALDAEDEDGIADAMDDYAKAEDLKDEADEAMAKAQAKEVEVELTMRRIQKKVIFDLISDPDDAETVYHYYY